MKIQKDKQKNISYKKITYIFARWLIKYFCYDVIEYLVRLIEYLF